MKQLIDMTEPELSQLMDLAGHAVETAARFCDVEKPLFVVLLFNDPHIAQYVSNCRREDVITGLREAADRLERREDMTRSEPH